MSLAPFGTEAVKGATDTHGPHQTLVFRALSYVAWLALALDSPLSSTAGHVGISSGSAPSSRAVTPARVVVAVVEQPTYRRRTLARRHTTLGAVQETTSTGRVPRLKSIEGTISAGRRYT